jgi:hypothetical protein
MAGGETFHIHALLATWFLTSVNGGECGGMVFPVFLSLFSGLKSINSHEMPLRLGVFALKRVSL